MKPIGVATLNAQILKAVIQIVKISGTLILMSLLLLFSSCEKSDDFATIRNESPIDNESPSDNETPPDETPPVDEPPVDEPPADNETPPDDEPPIDKESIIIYTDIEPDFTSRNLTDYYNLDLNNDQIIDFTVRSDSSEGWEFLVISSISKDLNGIISVAPWYTYALPLNSGQEIFNLWGYKDGEFYSNWGFLFDCYTIEQNCFHYWEDKVDGYLGLKFIINGKTHYGWAQVNVTSVTQWTIMDYAYNATPNMPIFAGQMN